MELAALILELQILVKGKIPHLYHQEGQELLLQFHVPNQGKKLLKIIPGKWLCLTQVKESAIRPSGFCMLLRKYLDNAFVKAIYQKDSERIVVFELEKKEKYYLMVTDENFLIIGVLEKQEWKDRSVKPGEKYVFPASPVSWRTVTEKEFIAIVQKSEKKNVATCLATDIGLGGVYAEEMCARAKIDKNRLPAELGADECAQIYSSLREMMLLLSQPKGYMYVEQITPFPLTNSTLLKVMETYTEAIDTLIPFAKSSPYEKKIKSMEHMIAEQEEAIKTQEESIELNTTKAELVYQKYQPLQQLLAIVSEMRKTKKWNEIAQELRKEKKITSVDLKTKKIVVEL